MASILLVSASEQYLRLKFLASRTTGLGENREHVDKGECGGLLNRRVKIFALFVGFGENQFELVV